MSFTVATFGGALCTPSMEPVKVFVVEFFPVELGRGGLGDSALDPDERGITLCPRESEATVMAFRDRKSARRECVLS
jgi:hypothetical protein